jgi:hypothetical protein
VGQSSVLPAYIAYTSLVLCSLVLDIVVLGNLLVLPIKDLVTLYF